MNKDYLWDRSGEPDPEIQNLENTLRPLRYNRPAPEFAGIPVAKTETRWYTRLWPGISWQLAYGSAAMLLTVILLAAGWLLITPKRSYEVVRLDGAPRVDASQIASTGRMHIGQWLETDGSSRARIQIGEIGQVEIEPNTRIRLDQARAAEHRLSIQRGILHALIWAPPRQFFVNTPSAQVVDLGCAYTLEVSDEGTGLLKVTTGWVAFESGGHDSFVPAGAMCLTRPITGPGTPFRGEASPAFREALERLDFSSADPPSRADALGTVLSEARKEDTLTLWHLLTRRDEKERARIYDRLIQLVPPPAAVTREGILAQNQQMLYLWWNELGLGDAQWWLQWKQPYPAQK
jgi:hypothetical protein